jgi:hypothetical protein
MVSEILRARSWCECGWTFLIPPQLIGYRISRRRFRACRAARIVLFEPAQASCPTWSGWFPQFECK